MARYTKLTELGYIYIEEEKGFIVQISYQDSLDDNNVEPNLLLTRAFEQLEEYFKGKRTKFTLPLKINGNDFTNKVLQVIQDIPYGTVKTYKEVAILAGNPLASRAVGNICRNNPLPIVIPCHRVVGQNGKLVGYNGGLARKKQLLEVEQNNVSNK